jgi:hypothetical protein
MRFHERAPGAQHAPQNRQWRPDDARRAQSSYAAQNGDESQSGKQ